MKKLLWISRHAMTAEQVMDLHARFGGVDATIVMKNVTWHASADAEADQTANLAIWRALFDDGDVAVVAGVFPPVALEVLPWDPSSVPVVTPVSEQDPSKRVGDGPIPFRHLRFASVT